MNKVLTNKEIEHLRLIPYISSVNRTRIAFSNEFKLLFIEQYYHNNIGPTEIFRMYGIDPKLIGSKRIESAARRWKKSWSVGVLGKNKDYNSKSVDDISTIEQLRVENGQLKKRIIELETKLNSLAKV